MNTRLFLTLLILPFFGYAQSPFGNSLEQGETGKMDRPWKLVTSGEWAVTFKPKKTKVTVAEFDVASLDLNGEHKLNLKYDNKRLKLVDVIAFNEEVYCLTSYKNKSKSKKYYLLQKYLGQGKLGKPTVISGSDWVNGPKMTFSAKKNMNNIANTNSIKFVVSNNKNYLAILVPTSNLSEKDEEDEWNACILSADMSKKSIVFKTGGTNFKIGEVVLKDNGDLLGIAVEEVTGANGNIYGGINNRGKPDYQILGNGYSLFAVDYEDEEVSHQKVDLDDERRVSSYSLAYLKNKVVFCGFYRDENDTKFNAFAAGYFYYLFDENINIENYDFVPFDERMDASVNDEDLEEDDKEVSNRKKKKEQKKKEKKKREKLEDLIIQDVFLRENGDVVIVAEQFDFYITTTTTSTANGTQTTTTYHYIYGDILTVSFDVDNGEAKWMSRIPKNQHSTNDGGFYSSYQLIESEDQLHFLFNDRLYFVKLDEYKNASRSERKKALKSRVLGGATISEQGEITRYVVIDEEKYDKKAIAPAFSTYSENQITSFTVFREGILKKRFGLTQLEFLND